MLPTPEFTQNSVKWTDNISSKAKAMVCLHNSLVFYCDTLDTILRVEM